MSYGPLVAIALRGQKHSWQEETRRRLIAACTVKTNAPIPDLWKRYFDQVNTPGRAMANRFKRFSSYPFAYAALALPDA